MELTWYGPVNDLPAVLPLRPAPEPAHTEPNRGADAFHPRQTIISAPLHPTHPRQTLLQPQAPPEPPKILPALPNIVQLADSEPAKPKLRLTPEQLQQMRPEAPAPEKSLEAAAPEVSLQEKRIGVVNLASSAQALSNPALPVTPMSAPHAVHPEQETGVAVPRVVLPGSGGPATLIALSATPAPVAPPPDIPPGNLSARISISPDGPKPGSPPGSAGVQASAGGPGGHGPEGIFISGGNPARTAPSSGLGIGAATRIPVDALPSRPLPRVLIPPPGSKPLAADPRPEALAPGAPPEEVLGSKRVYTLHINMPNLTSASGSWVLNFAEMDDSDDVLSAPTGVSELTGPVPLRKVDPKYPPELRTEHVEGEVVLYAVIRNNGSVDSIQLVHGVDPRLDTNAMEALAQWKFRPAEKNGVPVNLEAVVHIPFRSRLPEMY
jgi:periplasmic protein TonB